jgi:hypothetical protein
MFHVSGACLYFTLLNNQLLKIQSMLFIFYTSEWPSVEITAVIYLWQFWHPQMFFLLTLQTNHAMKIHSRKSFLFHTSNKTEINSSTTRNIYIKTNNWKWHLMSLKTTLLLFNAWSLSWNSHLHGRCIIKRKRDSNSCFGPCL